MPVTEDAREMCFAQGKSCVYASDEDRFIISETPAGVMDRHELATGQVTRVWPDGTEETFPADNPKHHEYRHGRDRQPHEGPRAATTALGRHRSELARQHSLTLAIDVLASCKSTLLQSSVPAAQVGHDPPVSLTPLGLVGSWRRRKSSDAERQACCSNQLLHRSIHPPSASVPLPAAARRRRR